MRRLALPTFFALLLAGCGGDDAPGGDPGVVATTTQAADLVRAVAGRHADVRALLRPGADPHDYEPRPSDARAIAEAELVVRSGGEVDEWLGDLARGDAPVLTLLDEVRRRGEDPHWWQDPRNGALAAQAIGAAIGEVDPANADSYRSAAEAYAMRLLELDRAIAACIGRVPASRRKIVTTHDSLGYLAARYGIEVVGAIIPGRSSQAQPSAGEVDDLVGRIRSEGVRAVFPESALDPRLERAIAREAGAVVGDVLYVDALGPAGSGAATYEGAMAANARALARGMSGGSVECRL